MSETSPAVGLGQGISLINLPLPFHSPRSVNAYVVEGSDGLLLIDCGVDSPECRRALFGGLDQLGYSPPAIDTLVVSHLHPDHVGMSSHLTSTYGMRLVMHQRAAKLVDRYNDSAGFAQRTHDLAVRHAVPLSSFDDFVDLGPRPDWMPNIEQPDQLVEEGDAIAVGSDRELEVIFTPGHEPAHICLRDSRTGRLFAGDHILPRITPLVAYDELFPDVLGEFLESLRKIEKLGLTTTYPAHGDVLPHGSARADQIQLHHERRLANMRDVVKPLGTSAWEVMEQVFRPNLGPMDQRFALRETVAHLEHLVLTGRLRSDEENQRLSYLG
ncbi:MAG: MBL fold metallo-hydrolase [Actinobacteria bacterium]|nr:MBL fold metallo-hydrolase [Actinomycetota bacterium]